MEEKDIEILEIDDEVKKIKKDKDEDSSIIEVKTTNKKGNKKLPKKKRKLKKGIIQTLFCLFSLIFIIGCFIFYGQRLVKYYKIYNPKNESGESVRLISSVVTKETPVVTEGEGLYNENGIYIYKGSEVNNYVKFSNMIWRIVRTNSDGSIEIILDDYINILAWDFKGHEYIKSDIHKYINDEFATQINTDLLVKTTICTDLMPSIDKYSCNNRNTDYYVKLLAANDFLNSVAEGKTFISEENELVWLGTTAKEEKAWLANGGNISTTEDNNTYFVKPVVTLNNATQLFGGSGTKDDPFVIEENKKELKIGSYVTLGEDTWIVTNKEKDKVKLVYSTLYNSGNSTYRFDIEVLDYDKERDNSLAKLLNTTFYEELEYKDLLLDFDVCTAMYTDSYKDICKEKTTVKVGIPSVSDLKFNNEADGYFTSNKSVREGRIYYYDNDLISSKPGISRPYRPTIMIEIPKLTEGDGTKDNPFKVEV